MFCEIAAFLLLIAVVLLGATVFCLIILLWQLWPWNWKNKEANV